MSDEPFDVPPLRSHSTRRPSLEKRLRAITQDWRATADAWKREQFDASTMRPPQPGSAAVANWINWLNACAKQIDDELDNE